MQIIISVLIPGLGVWCKCVLFIMFCNILGRVLCLNQIFENKKVNGQMISLPSFMFKSRSCHCASLREGVRGNEVLTDLSWQRQFLFLGARGHNSDSSCPFRDSTGDSMGTRQQARRTDQTWLHLITRKASQLRWDTVGRTPLLLQCLPSPPWHTCTSRSYASCIHV